MRKLIILLICLFSLTVTASAAGTVSELESNTRILADGTCEVSIVMLLRVDSGEEIPGFPVPGNAKDITVNGKSVKMTDQGNYRHASLSEVISGAGIHLVTVQYSLPDAVTLDKENVPYLNLELLCGFAYPVEKLSFVITLPGAPEHDPVFFSTYYQDTADTLLDVSIQGNEIRGTANQPLKDRESLRLTLEVSEELFPQSVAKRWRMGTDEVLILGGTLLALVYWLLSMSCLPPKHSRKTTAPEGLTAGDLGCCLTGQGVDFTMMVLSWAQMGYVRIHVERSGRVLLQKCMSMGNERSDFEIQYFKLLFGKRDVVDAMGQRYARLCRMAGKTKPGVRQYFRRNSGNPYIFRFLSALVGLFGGISMALSFAKDTTLQNWLLVLLGGGCFVLSWMIQSGAGVLHLRRKNPLYLGVLASLLWIGLGVWARESGIALLVVLGQWLAGFAAAYGGHRNTLGQQYMTQILGLRRFLRKINSDELQQILQVNPEYYHVMAPYAMALGVDRKFTRAFANVELTECAYLTAEGFVPKSAKQWHGILREVVRTMDERQKPALWVRLFGR